MKYKVGDKVKFLRRTTNQWEDGIVIRVYEDERLYHIDGCGTYTEDEVKITNRQWLESLSNEELSLAIWQKMSDISNPEFCSIKNEKCKQIRCGEYINGWLQAEHKNMECKNGR